MHLKMLEKKPWASQLSNKLCNIIKVWCQPGCVLWLQLCVCARLGQLLREVHQRAQRLVSADHGAENHSAAPVMLARESRETLHSSAEIRGMRAEVLPALTLFGFLNSGAFCRTAGCRLDSFQDSTLYFCCFKSESGHNELSVQFQARYACANKPFFLTRRKVSVRQKPHTHSLSLWVIH